MANITMSVSEDLKHQMERFPEINWSEIARQAIREKIRQLLLLQEITSGSRLTDEDVGRIGTKIKKAIASRHG